ncbi:MAG TPA: aminopeptidase [Pyrinomonadaceae bacterium]|nr:aminopeptidase [Pyrinomonadaceae bacterium]
MKKILAPLAALAAGFALAGCAPKPAEVAPAKLADDVKPDVKKAPPTDLEQLAQRLVAQSAGVKEGEIVLVGGGPQDMELLEDIAVQVRKAGAFPLVTVNTDRLTKRMYTDVPDKYDSQPDALDLKLAEIANVSINVDSNTTEGLLADADPKRMAARAKVGEDVGEAFLKNNVRSVEVGNGLYPTDWRAKRFGMTADDLAKIFWGGVNVDYADLQTRGEQVRAALASGNELHITDSGGTDFRVRVQGRPYGVSDGIISADDVKKGGGAVNIYLPAGEVYVTPVPGTAEGKIARAKEYFGGKEINNLTLTFAAGKLTSITGSGPGFDLLKAQYDAAGDGKDLFALVDFGINPNVKLPASSTIATWVPAGTVTVGVGNNTWAGGDNKSPYAYDLSLPGTTVTLDGKTVVENGQLKL